MNNSTLHPSRSKYISLIKQTTGIELQIHSADEKREDVKPIRETAAGDHVYVKYQELPLSQRAQRREQLIKARQQHNLEQIFSLALEFIRQDANFDRLDADWMMRFSELASECYSHTMHELWAKILSVELSTVGTFSYKSLKTLSEISVKEAQIFYSAVKLLCRLGEDRGGKILTGAYKKPSLMSIFSSNQRIAVNLGKFGLSVTHIMVLSELGLMFSQEIESAAYPQGSVVKLSYQSENHELQVLQKEVVFTYYKLTQTGQELAKLVNFDMDKKYLQTLLTEFSSVVKKVKA